jgi:hypothetical protein
MRGTVTLLCLGWLLGVWLHLGKECSCAPALQQQIGTGRIRVVTALRCRNMLQLKAAPLLLPCMVRSAVLPVGGC